MMTTYEGLTEDEKQDVIVECTSKPHKVYMECSACGMLVVEEGDMQPGDGYIVIDMHTCSGS